MSDDNENIENKKIQTNERSEGFGIVETLRSTKPEKKD